MRGKRISYKFKFSLLLFTYALLICNQAYEKKFNDKKMLTDHLNLIILENEKKKEHKLAEMMEKLGVTNGEFSGWEGFKDEEPGKT
jgi:hypothetical protein